MAAGGMATEVSEIAAVGGKLPSPCVRLWRTPKAPTHSTRPAYRRYECLSFPTSPLGVPTRKLPDDANDFESLARGTDRWPAPRPRGPETPHPMGNARHTCGSIGTVKAA